MQSQPKSQILPRYFLNLDFSETEIEISPNQYHVFHSAMTLLLCAKEIENIFQVFARAFINHEKELLEMVLEYSHFDSHYAITLDNLNMYFDDIKGRTNVNLLTILTAYKSYDDHCDRALGALTELSSVAKFNDETRSSVYDNNLSYRICTKLRNYAQHRALPLDNVSASSSANLLKDKEGRSWSKDSAFTNGLFLNVDKFRQSSQCNAPLRKELNDLNCGKIDLKWLIRSFTGAVAERHIALREYLTPQIESAGDEIRSAYAVAKEKSHVEFENIELCSDRQKLHLDKKFASSILASFKTHKSLRFAERKYVTSQITIKDGVYSG